MKCRKERTEPTFVRSSSAFEAWPLLSVPAYGETFWSDEDRWRTPDEPNPVVEWWEVLDQRRTSVGFFTVMPWDDHLEWGTLFRPEFDGWTLLQAGIKAHRFVFHTHPQKEVWHRVGGYNRKAAVMLSYLKAEKKPSHRFVTWNGIQWPEHVYVIRDDNPVIRKG